MAEDVEVIPTMMASELPKFMFLQESVVKHMSSHISLMREVI